MLVKDGPFTVSQYSNLTIGHSFEYNTNYLFKLTKYGNSRVNLSCVVTATECSGHSRARENGGFFCRIERVVFESNE
jgi:hypothetical protein